MRVLHIISKIGLGGAERVAETLAVLQADEGVDVAVLAVACGPDDDAAVAMRHRLDGAGIRVIQASGATSSKLAAFLAAPVIAREIARWQPNIIHLQTEVPEFTVALARVLSRRTRRCPTVRSIQNTINWPAWALAGRFSEWALRNAGAVAVSEGARDAFFAAHQYACPVVVNAVRLEHLVDRSEGVHDPPRYLYASRFETAKGIDTLLDALDILEKNRRTQFELTIVGAGRFAAEVRERAGGMSRHVEVRPPSGKLHAEMSQYDALVMPSRWEGLGLSAVEALCIGLPVLATAAPGLIDALPPDYPGRTPPGDPVALAHLLETFEEDPSPWLSRVASDRTWARNRFDAHTMAEGYAHIYAEVAA